MLFFSTTHSKSKLNEARQNLETSQTFISYSSTTPNSEAIKFIFKRAKQTMEKSSASRKTKEEGLLSCWGRLKLKLPCTKRKIKALGNSITPAFMPRKPRPVGGFRYDPLSYAHNFDDCNGDDYLQGSLYRGFSSRYAAPVSRSVAHK